MLQHPIRGRSHRSLVRVRSGAAPCTPTVGRSRLTTRSPQSGESLDRLVTFRYTPWDFVDAVGQSLSGDSEQAGDELGSAARFVHYGSGGRTGGSKA